MSFHVCAYSFEVDNVLKIGPGCDVLDINDCATPSSFGNNVFCNNVGSSCGCPYFDDIVAGTISGHPDFNLVTGGTDLNGGPPSDFYNGLSFVSGSGGASNLNIMVDRDGMQASTSGLFKPRYCSDNTLGLGGEARCGFNPTSTNFHYQTVSIDTD